MFKKRSCFHTSWQTKNFIFSLFIAMDESTSNHRDNSSSEHIMLVGYGHSSALSITDHDTDNDDLLPNHDCPTTGQTSSVNIKSQIFNRRLQTRSLFLRQSARWFGTISLSLCIIWTMQTYQIKGNFSNSDKSNYNVMFTGLSIELGINFFFRIRSRLWREILVEHSFLMLMQEAFKEAAKIFRWRVLANAPRSIRTLDLVLILSVESLHTQSKISLACAIWVSCMFCLKIYLGYICCQFRYYLWCCRSCKKMAFLVCWVRCMIV